MGLLKDIHDIIRENQAIRDIVRKELLSFFNNAYGGWLQKPKSIAERLTKIEELISEFSKYDFANKFQTRLDYFGFLIAIITEIAFLQNRGCLIRDLYNPNFHFYFPTPSPEPGLIKSVIRVTNEKAMALQYDEKRFYIFYAFSSENLPTSFKALQDKLESIIRTADDKEDEAFLKHLENLNIEVRKIQAVKQLINDNRFKFYCPDPFDDKNITISFLTPEDTKQRVVEDLKYVLTFKL